MNANDQTMVIQDGQEITPKANVEQEMSDNDNGTWKKVSIGAASGILLGAGALYAVNAFASDDNGTENVTPSTENVKVAKIADGLSFEDAFAAARAQVGSGGVFRWNGGIYSTYTEEEWNGMTDKEKSDFAYLVRPEVRADEIVAERMAEETSKQPQHEEVTANSHPHTHRTSADTNQEDVSTVDNAANDIAQNQTSQQSQDIDDNDVHIVGQGTIHGHQAVALDITGNGEADVAIIDWNDNGRLDDPDVMIDRNGNYATIGQLAQAENGQTPSDGQEYTADAYTNIQDPNMQYTDFNTNENTGDVGTDIGGDECGVQDDSGFVAL